MIHTNTMRTHGIIFGLPSLSFCKILSHNIARVIIVQDIKTVQYRNIDDQIIHQIHHQINVVKAMEVRILSFFTIHYLKSILELLSNYDSMFAPLSPVSNATIFCWCSCISLNSHFLLSLQACIIILNLREATLTCLILTSM